MRFTNRTTTTNTANRHLPRRSMLGALTGALGGLAFAGRRQERPAAAAETEASHVGTWIAVNGPATNPRRHLTIHADGTLLLVNAVPGQSAGTGVWIRVGERRYQNSVVIMRFDAGGAWLGSQRTWADGRLNEAGDEYTTTVTLEEYDTNNDPVPGSRREGTGATYRRLTVE